MSEECVDKFCVVVLGAAGDVQQVLDGAGEPFGAVILTVPPSFDFQTLKGTWLQAIDEKKDIVVVRAKDGQIQGVQRESSSTLKSSFESFEDSDLGGALPVPSAPTIICAICKTPNKVARYSPRNPPICSGTPPPNHKLIL